MRERQCRNPYADRRLAAASVLIEVGERGLVAVETHGDEFKAARLLDRVASGINVMEAAVNGRPLMPGEVLGLALADLAIRGRAV